MHGSERVVIASIFEQLYQEDLDDDEQMACLVHLLDDLELKELPIEQIVEFMLMPCAESEDIWLLSCEHLETWDACQSLVIRDPRRVPVDRMVAAVSHAYQISEPDEADDTDDNLYLDRIIELAGNLGTRFPADALTPMLQDERILVRRKVIEALALMEAGSPITAMLGDVSAQIRIFAMEHLGWLDQLTDEQLQMLAIDTNARVRAAAQRWMQRHRPTLAAATKAS